VKLGDKPRYPKARTLVLAIETLQRAVPTEDGFTFAWRSSEAGVPNLRVTGRTGEIRWYVDIYHGHYYRAVAGDELGAVWRTLPGLVGYLRRQLSLGPIPQVAAGVGY
jgi:hypothetical protein